MNLLVIIAKYVSSGTSSWKEQFTEALTVSGGDEEEGEGAGEPISPSSLDYLMHGLTLLWKVLFAFVPPTGKLCDIELHSKEWTLLWRGKGWKWDRAVSCGVAASGTRKLCLSTAKRDPLILGRVRGTCWNIFGIPATRVSPLSKLKIADGGLVYEWIKSDEGRAIRYHGYGTNFLSQTENSCRKLLNGLKMVHWISY